MSTRRPLVSIGLPVFNGERFVAAAIQSLLSQTIEDLEIIVCDNASTDGTEAICRQAAACDTRVRYFRNETNLGAAANFNRAFRLSSGKYFKWAACDDRCEPTYVERCLEVLEKDPSVVLCYTRTCELDEQDRLGAVYDFPPLATSNQPHLRFRDLVVVHHPCVAVFGVIRREILESTPLIATYVASDRVLLAELGLYGRFCELPDLLFHRRMHSGNSIWLGMRGSLLAWYDPRLAGRINLPHWRVVGEMARAAARAPLSFADRLRCLMQLPAHMREWRGGLREDLVVGLRRQLARVKPLRSLVRALRARLEQGRTGS